MALWTSVFSNCKTIRWSGSSWSIHPGSLVYWRNHINAVGKFELCIHLLENVSQGCLETDVPNRNRDGAPYLRGKGKGGLPNGKLAQNRSNGKLRGFE